MLVHNKDVDYICDKNLCRSIRCLWGLFYWISAYKRDGG